MKYVSDRTKERQSGKKKFHKADVTVGYSLPIKITIGLAIVLAVVFIVGAIYFVASSYKGETQNPAIGEVPKSDWPALVSATLIEAPPSSVISLSPMLTSILSILPIEQKLVAVSEYCDNITLALPTVGTPLLPKTAEIIALKPEYLLIQSALSKTAREQISMAGIKILSFATPADFEGMKALTAELCTLFSGAKTGTITGYSIYDRFTSSLASYNDAITSTRPKFLLLPDLSGISATSDTFEYSIFKNILGNVSVDAKGWNTTLEDLIASNPEVLIVDSGYNIEQVANAGFNETAAFTTGRVYFIDFRLLESYNPQLIYMVSQLAHAIYPDLSSFAPPKEEPTQP